MFGRNLLSIRVLGLSLSLSVFTSICIICFCVVGTSIQSGQQLSFAANKTGNTEIYLLDVSRLLVANLTANPAYDIMPTWTPDGEQIVFASNRDGDFNLYSYDLTTGITARLTQHPADELSASVSPDGTALVFMSDREGTALIYRGEMVNLADDTATGLTERRSGGLRTASDLPSWSPDGNEIVYQRRGERIAWELHVMAADGTNSQSLIELVDTDTRQPGWSPDGGQVVFQAQNLSGYADIYIIDVQTRRYRPLMSTQYAHESWPVWSPDSQSITYIEKRYTPSREAIMMIEPDSTVPRYLFSYGQSMLTLAWRPNVKSD